MVKGVSCSCGRPEFIHIPHTCGSQMFGAPAAGDRVPLTSMNICAHTTHTIYKTIFGVWRAGGEDAGEMAGWLRVCTALPKALSSTPGTHMAPHNRLIPSSGVQIYIGTKDPYT